MQVTFNVKLPATIRREGDWFVSACPVLDIASQGKSEREALNNLVEAAQVFLLSCYERGTLDQVLKDCGFRPLKKVSGRMRTLKKPAKWIDVALPFSAPIKGRAEHCPA